MKRIILIMAFCFAGCNQDYVPPKEPIDDNWVECEFTEDCILMPVNVCLTDKSMITYGAYARCVKNDEGISECKFYDSPIRSCEDGCNVNSGTCY